MKLMDYLQDNGLSIAEFADAAGLSAEGIRLILKGERLARRSTAARICDATKGQVTHADLAEILPAPTAAPSEATP